MAMSFRRFTERIHLLDFAAQLPFRSELQRVLDISIRIPGGPVNTQIAVIENAAIELHLATAMRARRHQPAELLQARKCLGPGVRV